MCPLRRRRQPVALAVPALLLAGAAGTACGASAQAVEYWAFTAPWDARSDSAVRAHGAKLDAIVAGWIALDSATAQPVRPPLFEDRLRIQDGTALRMALVTTWHGDRFHPETIRALARDPDALDRAAAAVAEQAAASGYGGLVFDFEALEPDDLGGLLAVLEEMAGAARRRGIGTIAVAIPATETRAYPAEPLLAVADALIVMLYDQHWSGSEPGPISDPDWVRSSLAIRLDEVGPDRLIAGLPLYGYHWRPGGPAEPVSFAEAAARARRAGAPLARDVASQTLRSAARDSEIWVTDAALLTRLVEQVGGVGVRRVALWRLGQEDPAIWTDLIGRD
ncbi:MAG: hypothetical protein ACRELV_10015 [Longimicrobiales bacterium]